MFLYVQMRNTDHIIEQWKKVTEKCIRSHGPSFQCDAIKRCNLTCINKEAISRTRK